MANGVSELLGTGRTASTFLDMAQNSEINEANKGYNKREDELFRQMDEEASTRDASGKTQYERTAEAGIKESEETVERLNKQIEAEKKANADTDRLARLQQERDEAEKLHAERQAIYNRHRAEENAKAFTADQNNQKAYQDAVLDRQAAEQREAEIRRQLDEAQKRAEADRRHVEEERHRAEEEHRRTAESEKHESNASSIGHTDEQYKDNRSDDNRQVGTSQPDYRDLNANSTDRNYVQNDSYDSANSNYQDNHYQNNRQDTPAQSNYHDNGQDSFTQNNAQQDNLYRDSRQDSLVQSDNYQSDKKESPVQNIVYRDNSYQSDRQSFSTQSNPQDNPYQNAGQESPVHSNDFQNDTLQNNRQDFFTQGDNHQDLSAQNESHDGRQKDSSVYRDTYAQENYRNDTVQSNNSQNTPRQETQPYRDVSEINNGNEQNSYQNNRYENSQQNARPDSYESRQDSQPVYSRLDNEQNLAYQQANENQSAYHVNTNQPEYSRQDNPNQQDNTQQDNVRNVNQHDQNKKENSPEAYGYATANEIESARRLTESLERQAEEARRQADAVRQVHEQELMKDESVNQSKQAYESAVNVESSAKVTYEQAQVQADHAEQNYYRTVETQVNNALSNDAEYQKLQTTLQKLEESAAKGNPRPYEESITQTKAAIQKAEDNARTKAYTSAEVVAAKDAWETQKNVVSQAQNAYDSAKSNTYKAENAYNVRVADYADAHGMNDLKEAWETSKATSVEAAKAHNAFVDNLAKTPESIRKVDNLRQELNSVSEAKKNYSNTVEHFERQERLSKSADQISRYEFGDRKEYEQAVAVLEKKGVKVLASTSMMSNDRGQNVYVLQVSRSMGGQVEKVINERGLNGNFHGHIYKDGSYEAKRTDDNHGMGRDEKSVNKTKAQYQSGLSGYGNLMLRETGELYHAYLMANDINDFIKGALNAAAMQTASMDSEGNISFHLKETGDAGLDAEGQYRYRMDLWKNPYEALGLKTGAFDETKMRIRGDSDEFVQKLSKETGRNIYADKGLREISVGYLTRGDIAKITTESLDKLKVAGLIAADAKGNLDIAALYKLSPDALKKAGIDPEMFQKVVLKDLEGINSWGAFAGVKAAGASVGKGLLKFTSKFDDNEGNLSQTVNEVRQGVDYIKRPVQEVQKAAKKAKTAWQSRRQIRNPGSAAANKVDASKVKIEQPQSTKLKKRQTKKIKKQEKAVAKATANIDRRLKILEKWDKSIMGRTQKKLAQVTSNFFAKTAIGKAIGAVVEAATTAVKAYVAPAIGIILLGMIGLAGQTSNAIIIVCLINSLFDYEISPDEGVTYTVYHDILKEYEDDWLEEISNVNGDDTLTSTSLWTKIERGKDIRFGYEYKPWEEYAKTRSHLIVQDNGRNIDPFGVIHYTDLAVYLNPFTFKPLYPEDYYVKITKNGTTDSSTHIKVGAFGDAGNMITFYPNMSSFAKKGAGGHTSNVKDIICMMDVMFNFQKTSDVETADITDTTGARLALNWIENRLKYGLRLVMDIFTPTPHDPSVSLIEWSHMKAYCEQLFMATHQEMVDVDVIIFDCNKSVGHTDATGNPDYYFTDSVVDANMTDENYRTSMLEGYLATGCPGTAQGGCRQSKFYACVGGSSGAYTAHLGIVADEFTNTATGTSYVKGQFGHVATLDETNNTFDKVKPVDSDFCLNNQIVAALNNVRTAGVTSTLKNFLDDSDCWYNSITGYEMAGDTADYLYWTGADSSWDDGPDWVLSDPSSPPSDIHDWSDGVPDAYKNPGRARITYSSDLGDNSKYSQYIVLAIPRMVTEVKYADAYHAEDDDDPDTDDVDESDEEDYDVYRYHRVFDLYIWSIAHDTTTGKLITTLPSTSNITVNLDGDDISATGMENVTTCVGHDCRYCGGHTFVDMKGIIYSFTDSEIAATNGKMGNFSEDQVYIFPVIDEEKLESNMSVAKMKGSYADPSLIHETRLRTYQAAGVYGINILVNNPDNPTQWVSGYDPKNNIVVPPNMGAAIRDASGGLIIPLRDADNYMTPVTNPNTWMNRTATGGGFTFDGVAVNPWNTSDSYKVNKMLYLGADIFDIDASIDYPYGFFPVTTDGYTGWTETNMLLALERYNMSWEDTYDFDIPVNFSCPQLSGTQVAQIVDGVRKKYPNMTSGEEDAITAALQAVGNGQYSQMHHDHGYLLNLDIYDVPNMDNAAANRNLIETAGHPCTSTDCSGFASYVITMGGDSRILSEKTGDRYQVWSTSGFLDHGAASTPWDGTVNSLRPGDVFIHTNGTAHALVYIGCLTEDLTISWIKDDGGYTFARNAAGDGYDITSQITLKAGKPITVDCTRIDSKGNIYLRNGGITHSWLPSSPYITANDGAVYVYRPDYTH